MRLLTAGLVVWAAFWMGIAVYTAHKVMALRSLSRTVVKAGTATQSTGEALTALAGLPFVGGRVARLGNEAIAAGASARVSGASTATTVDQFAVLIGIAIALIPTVPLLAVYVPLLLSWRRDRTAICDAVARWDGEPGLEEFLAQRALVHLSFPELRQLGFDGTGHSPSSAELAAGELRRLGLETSTLGATRRSPTEPAHR